MRCLQEMQTQCKSTEWRVYQQRGTAQKKWHRRRKKWLLYFVPAAVFQRNHYSWTLQIHPATRTCHDCFPQARRNFLPGTRNAGRIWKILPSDIPHHTGTGINRLLEHGTTCVEKIYDWESAGMESKRITSTNKYIHNMSLEYTGIPYFPLTSNFFEEDVPELLEAKFGIKASYL